MTTRPLALLTSSAFPDLIPEERATFPLLREAGFEPSPVIWEKVDPAAPGFDAFIVRSCWDYHLKAKAFAAFLSALEARGVPVANPARICRWNLEKRYLLELRDGGVAIPQTVLVEAGSARALPEVLEAAGFAEAVVKPAVSADAYRTWRTRPSEARAERERFAQMLGDGAVLVQRFLPEIQSVGEVSVVFFGGQYSHAAIKRPKAGDFRTQAGHGGKHEPFSPSRELRAFAEDVLRRVDAPVLYARVDLVPTANGPVLMELELIDPVLFFAMDEKSPRRWAAAVAAHFAQKS